MKYQYNDGGRKEAGYKANMVGDCVIRAIAIATDIPYKEVYKDIFNMQKDYAKKYNTAIAKKLRKRGASPRLGVYDQFYIKYLKSKGWIRIAEKHTLDSNKFKKGTYICTTRRHLTTIIDGVLHDSYECSMTKGIINSKGEYIPPKVRTAFSHYIKER